MPARRHITAFVPVGTAATLSLVLMTFAAPGHARSGIVGHPMACTLTPNGTERVVGMWPTHRDLPIGAKISIMMDLPDQRTLWKDEYVLQEPWAKGERRYLPTAYPPEILCRVTATSESAAPLSRSTQDTRVPLRSPRIVKPDAVTPKIVPRPLPGGGQPPRQR